MAYTEEPVIRFLRDAEEAAERGERETALDLLLLALDIAPGEPTVLAQAHRIRARLPVPKREEDEWGLDFMEGSNLALDDMKNLSDAKKNKPSAFSLPEMNVLLEDDEPEPNFGGYSLEKVISGPGLGIVPPQEASGEEEGQGTKKSSRTTRGQKKFTRYILWPVLGVLALLLVLVATSPDFLGTVANFGASWFDPLAQAESELAEGNAPGARTLALPLVETETGIRKGRALFVLAGAAWEEGEMARGNEYALEAAQSSQDWEFSLSVARALKDVGALEAATGAYVASFEQGAPHEHWLEMADALYEAGYVGRARTFYNLWERGASEEARSSAEPRPYAPEEGLFNSAPTTPEVDPGEVSPESLTEETERAVEPDTSGR